NESLEVVHLFWIALFYILQINNDHLLLMAVDLFFEYWLAMFLFPHKYAILFLFLKHSLSVFLIVYVSFPIVLFFLAFYYFLQSNINNSHFWSLDHSSVFPVFLK